MENILYSVQIDKDSGFFPEGVVELQSFGDNNIDCYLINYISTDITFNRQPNFEVTVPAKSVLKYWMNSNSEYVTELVDGIINLGLFTGGEGTICDDIKLNDDLKKNHVLYATQKATNTLEWNPVLKADKPDMTLMSVGKDAKLGRMFTVGEQLGDIYISLQGMLDTVSTLQFPESITELGIGVFDFLQSYPLFCNVLGHVQKYEISDAVYLFSNTNSGIIVNPSYNEVHVHTSDGWDLLMEPRSVYYAQSKLNGDIGGADRYYKIDKDIELGRFYANHVQGTSYSSYMKQFNTNNLTYSPIGSYGGNAHITEEQFRKMFSIGVPFEYESQEEKYISNENICDELNAIKTTTSNIVYHEKQVIPREDKVWCNVCIDTTISKKVINSVLETLTYTDTGEMLGKVYGIIGNSTATSGILVQKFEDEYSTRYMIGVSQNGTQHPIYSSDCGWVDSGYIGDFQATPTAMDVLNLGLENDKIVNFIFGSEYIDDADKPIKQTSTTEVPLPFVVATNETHAIQMLEWAQQGKIIMAANIKPNAGNQTYSGICMSYPKTLDEFLAGEFGFTNVYNQNANFGFTYLDGWVSHEE